MDYRDSKGWSMPFLVSAIFHLIMVFVFGLIIHYTPPSDPVEKQPIMVEIYDPGGGGGEPAPEESVSPDTSPEEVMTEESVTEDIQPQIPPISDATVDKQEIKPKPKSSVHRKTSQTGRGTGGSGSGTGGGHGSGHGTGTGSGTGSGHGDSSGPQVLSAPKPNYPSAARKAGVEGTVTVGLVIEVDGRVSSAWVESSSGNGELDQAAVSAVQRWKFVPAKSNGQAITAQSRVPVSFRLKDA